MEQTQENQTSSQPANPVPPEIKNIKDNKLREFALRHQKEYWFGCWNLALFMWEITRDAKHYSPQEWPGLGRGIPIATEGLGGFIDQHIGDTVETIEFFYLSRIPVSLLARAVEILTDKKIDPRIKIGTSLLLSVTAVSALELTGRGGVSDPLDTVGAVFAGIWGTVGYQVIDYLFRPRETPLFDQWWDRVSKLAKSAEEIDQKLLAKLDSWTQQLSSAPTTEKVAIAPNTDTSNDQMLAE